MDNNQITDLKNEVRILNQLLAAQSIIHIFPNTKKLGEFLVQVLKTIPGVRYCSACLRNESEFIGDNSDFASELMATLKDIPHDKNHITKILPIKENFVTFILQTTKRQFGFVVLSINNIEFEKYKPATNNFINTIALNLENHWRNEELALYKNNLEELVKERTAELELKVTELKLADDELKKSRKLLAETERIGKVGGWELDIDTGKQSWTEEVYRIHEVDPTFNPDLENGINFYTPESLPIIENAVKRAVELGEPFNLELDIITAKGNIRSVHAIGEADLQNRRVFGFFQDVTKRKQAEDKLLSEHALRKSIELSLSSGIAVVNKEGKQIYVNPAFCKMVGWSEVELLGKTAPYVYWPAEQLDVINDAFQMTINDMAPKAGFELVFINKDNVRFPVQVIISPLIEGEQTVGWLANVQDITERKSLEEELYKNRILLESIVNQTPDAIYIKDMQGRYIIFNRAAEQFTNKKMKDVIGKDDTFLFSAEEAEVVMKGDQKVISNGKISTYEEIVTTFHNIKTTFLSTKGPIYDITGNPIGLFGIARDITERKQAEIALTESEQRYKLLFQNLNSLFSVYEIVLDESGKPIDLRFLQVNSAYEEFIGIKSSDLIGKSLLEVFPATEEYWIEKIADVALSGIPTNYENYSTELDKYLELSIYSPEHNQIALLGQDITYRKKAEVDINNKNIELAELNASKDKFFSIIAHDLRSPFNGFLGLTKLMAEETSDFTLIELQEISQKMQYSANNLYKLLENLLEWSRIQRGLTEFKPQICQLNDIIKQNIEIERDFAKQKNIEINLNLTTTYESKIDIPMIDTVLRNLITNAIKFTQRGGKIEIGITKTSDYSKSSDDSVYIKDNGIGMDSDRLAKLFKIDQNVTRPGTEKEPSTGLGLLLCNEFINKHGGRIWAESEEGKGSTFYFSLPKDVQPIKS